MNQARNTDERPPIRVGSGYANLQSGDSFSGILRLYPNWVDIETDNGDYTVPRSRVDYLSWREVEE